jgi:hypothetical protein
MDTFGHVPHKPVAIEYGGKVPGGSFGGLFWMSWRNKLFCTGIYEVNVVPLLAPQ